MRIEDVIRRVRSLPEAWVSVEQIRRISAGLELIVAVHKGRRGRKVSAWQVRCEGVREFQIADVDGGGLALHPSTHPAARQYLARQAMLRGSGCYDHDAALGPYTVRTLTSSMTGFELTVT